MRPPIMMSHIDKHPPHPPHTHTTIFPCLDCQTSSSSVQAASPIKPFGDPSGPLFFSLDPKFILVNFLLRRTRVESVVRRTDLGGPLRHLPYVVVRLVTQSVTSYTVISNG